MKVTWYFFALCLAVLNSPVVRAQVNWGCLAGGSLVSLYPHQEHGPDPLWEYNPGTYSLLVSGLAGVTAEDQVNRYWSVDASLSYEGCGAHATYGFGNLDGTETSKLNIRVDYLQLPLEVIYLFNPGHAVRFLAGGGIYGAVGVRGKERGTTVSWFGPNPAETSSFDNQIAFTHKAPTENELSYPSTVKPFDAGYTVTAGVQWAHFRLSPGFSQGLVNLFPGETFKGKSKSLSLSLVYWIHGG